MEEKNYSGNMIVIEGADAAGTSTQAQKIAEKLDCFYTAEHTDKKVGRKVDEMIKEGDYLPETIALGFACDRMIHIEEDVIPKLEKGETVVMDRYYHSSLVYQDLLGADHTWIKELHRKAVKPDITIVLDIDLDTVVERLKKRDGLNNNIFEKKKFQGKVIEKYRELEEKLEEEIIYVDADGTIEQVFDRIMEKIEEKDLL